MNVDKPFSKIIKEICEEQNIEEKMLSYNWIRELKKGDIIHHIINYQLDLNTANAYNISNDKFATYEVLSSNNIPTIEHRMIFNPQTRSNWYEDKFIKDAEKLLLENDNKVVIKANDSSKGKDVYFCSSKKEIENTVKQLFSENKNTLSACPYIDIDYEYRVIYFYGEILYIYKKEKPFVLGDGNKTLKQLINEKNKEYNINIEIINFLDLNYVPYNGEKVIISWKHNLSNGAIPIVINEDEEYIDKIKSIALSAGKAMNINFASIDIALTKNKKVLVMEVNASVCMNTFTERIPNGYNIAKDIYRKAIKKMFEN